MRQLSQAEKNVLDLLEQNCRLPANQIAKRCRLSPEGVIKIITRLQNRGLITRFNTKINYTRIGAGTYPAHIKLIRLNDAIRTSIKQTLKRYKICSWYSFCEGEFDLLLSFKILSTQDEADMHQCLLDISEYIAEKEISIVLNAFEVSKSFSDRPMQQFSICDHTIERIVLSTIELQLLHLLKTNARTPLTDLAKQLNISPATVTEKIKKLEREKVIVGYKTKLNMAKLNYQPCIAFLALSNHTPEQLNTFYTYCRYKKGINYVLLQIGKYDVELTIDVPDVNDFYKLMDEMREKFPFIKKATTLIVKEAS